MSNTSNPIEAFDGLVIDPSKLSRNSVNAVRTAFGILGLVGIALGVVLLVWPGATLMVVAGITAIFFVIAGLARTGFGIFGGDLSGSTRAVNLILGLLVLISGIVILKHLQSSTALLAIIIVIFIGIGWIIEGALTLATASRVESKGLAYFAGIIGIIAGIVVIAVPTWSALALVVFTGATFVLLGIISVIRAVTFGKDSTVIDV